VNPILVYITTRDKSQAEQIGRILVEERIVACVNIIDGMQSIYRWEGEICTDTETILVAKTRAPLFDKLVLRVKELHSYTVPCIVSLPIENGNPDYLKWIENETSSS
jgi:periplasmic divalent cation tolerance protein